MNTKYTDQKLKEYLQQAKALSKNINPAKAAAYGALGVGMLTLPVVPSIGQCNIAGASSSGTNLDLNGGGVDFTFTRYANALYITRANATWELLVNGNVDNGYPFVRNANGVNLVTATNWSNGKSGSFLVHKNGPLDDFELSSSGFIGVRFNGATLGFIQIAVGSGSPVTSTRDITMSGLDTNGGSAVAGDCASLPVELVSFIAKLRHESIELRWRTATETNNFGFEVQRSQDGISFRKIGWVDGAGNSYADLDYSFEDKDIEAGERYYYRFKQLDFDGETTTSPLLVVTSLGSGTIVKDAYPNPTDIGIVNVPIITESEAEWIATVFNAQGVELSQQKQFVLKGNSSLEISVDNLPKGQYFVRLDNGVEQFYKKINIQ